jgi:VanZ family protein
VRKIAENRILDESPCATASKEGNVSRFKAYAPALVWAALLLLLGGRSDVPTVETTLPLDKAAHFFFYGLLGALTIYGWRKAGRWPAVYVSLLLAISVGAVDELNQRRIAGRSSDVLDWFADTAGILTGGWVVLRAVKESRNAD